MKLGRGLVEVRVPEERLLGVLCKRDSGPSISEEETIRFALATPIGTKRLKEAATGKRSVCVVVSDITRAWQRMWVYLPLIVEELGRAGIRDEDITFLCATGYHRAPTREEASKILGPDLSNRFALVAHDSTSAEDLLRLGVTSRGTPVDINRRAVEADLLVLTGAVSYHPFAGYTGGRKSLLPGIASLEGIQRNHLLALTEEEGGGQRSSVRGGSTHGNPVHEDMEEASALVESPFLFNVIMGRDGRIAHAVCGDLCEAYAEGRRIVDGLHSVEVDDLGDITIASQGGHPKDPDLYQTGKSFYNARHCTKPGGTILVFSECAGGLGPKEAVEIFRGRETNEARERSVRESFTVPGYVSYFLCRLAEEYRLGVVGELNPAVLSNTNISAFNDPDQGVRWALDNGGNGGSVYLIPEGADVLPRPSREHPDEEGGPA